MAPSPGGWYPEVEGCTGCQIQQRDIQAGSAERSLQAPILDFFNGRCRDTSAIGACSTGIHPDYSVLYRSEAKSADYRTRLQLPGS